VSSHKHFRMPTGWFCVAVSATTIGSNPAIATEHDEFIQILTAEGKHYGDFDFSYSPPQEDITFLDCEIFASGRKPRASGPDENPRVSGRIRWRTIAARGANSFRCRAFAPGAVRTCVITRSGKTYPLPHVSLTVPLAMELPIVDSTVQISVAKRFGVSFHVSPNVGRRSGQLNKALTAARTRGILKIVTRTRT